MNDPTLAWAWSSGSHSQFNFSEEITAAYTAWTDYYYATGGPESSIECPECGYLNMLTSERCDMCDVAIPASLRVHRSSADELEIKDDSDAAPAPYPPEHWRGWETINIAQQIDQLPPDHVTTQADYEAIYLAYAKQALPPPPPGSPKDRDVAVVGKISAEGPARAQAFGSEQAVAPAAVDDRFASWRQDPKCQDPGFSIEIESVKDALDHWEVEEEFPPDFLNYSHSEMEVTAEVVVDGSAKRIMGGFVDMSVIPDYDKYPDYDEREPLPKESLAKRIHQRQKFTDVCQSPWLVLQNSGSVDTGFLPLRWAAVALEGETSTESDGEGNGSSEGESSARKTGSQPFWQAVRCKTYFMPVRRNFVTKQKRSRVREVQRWTMQELSDFECATQGGSATEDLWQRRAFYLQKKIRTLDTPMCSTYFIEYSVRITPRGLDQCLIQSSWAPVWLMNTGPFRSIIGEELRKGVFADSGANLHVVASKIAHWNAQNSERASNRRQSANEVQTVATAAVEEGGIGGSVSASVSGATPVLGSSRQVENTFTDVAKFGDVLDDFADEEHPDKDNGRVRTKKRWSMKKFMRRKQRGGNSSTGGVDDPPESPGRKKWRWSMSRVKSKGKREPSKHAAEGPMKHFSDLPDAIGAEEDIRETGTPHESEEEVDDDFEERIMEFYREHNPSKLDDVKGLVARYEGRKEALFDLLIAKCGVGDVDQDQVAVASSTAMIDTVADGSTMQVVVDREVDGPGSISTGTGELQPIARQKPIAMATATIQPLENNRHRSLPLSSEEIHGVLSE